MRPAPAPERGRVLSAQSGCQTVVNTGCRRCGAWPNSKDHGWWNRARNRKHPGPEGATFRNGPARIPKWLDAAMVRWHHWPAFV